MPTSMAPRCADGRPAARRATRGARAAALASGEPPQSSGRLRQASVSRGAARATPTGELDAFVTQAAANGAAVTSQARSADHA
jgi:hypothetical protein